MSETSTQAEVLPITITDSAASKVAELIIEEGNFNLKLRIYIEGGGCSGYQYGFNFEEEKAEDDWLIVKEVKHGHGNVASPLKVEFLVDPMSFQYLMNATIDYVEDLEGERFIIRNPNASTTCGCGSSFSVEDEKDAD